MAYITKERDPEDKLDYRIDWRDETITLPEGKVIALAEDETIATSTWAAYDLDWEETDDITIHDELNSKTDTTATGWNSGGTRGNAVYFTNHIVTNQGRELSKSIKIKIKEQ